MIFMSRGWGGSSPPTPHRASRGGPVLSAVIRRPGPAPANPAPAGHVQRAAHVEERVRVINRLDHRCIGKASALSVEHQSFFAPTVPQAGDDINERTRPF